MKQVKFIKATAAPLPLANIDTDAIYPKQFLKTMKRTGLGEHAFHDLRYRPDGTSNPDFILNKSDYRGAAILITGGNFGSGSSREHAVWSLLDCGIECVIASGFGDIFYENCFKNGLLPVVLPQDQVDELMKEAEINPDALLEIDLEKQTVTRGNKFNFSFEIDSFRKNSLMQGLDEIGHSLAKKIFIEKYEDKIAGEKPWLMPPS